MNLLLQVLIATALIAGFILLRLFTDRRALQARIRKSHADSGCVEGGCFRGCGPHNDTGDSDSVPGENP